MEFLAAFEKGLVLEGNEVLPLRVSWTLMRLPRVLDLKSEQFEVSKAPSIVLSTLMSCGPSVASSSALICAAVMGAPSPRISITGIESSPPLVPKGLSGTASGLTSPDLTVTIVSRPRRPTIRTSIVTGTGFVAVECAQRNRSIKMKKKSGKG